MAVAPEGLRGAVEGVSRLETGAEVKGGGEGEDARGRWTGGMGEAEVEGDVPSVGRGLGCD